MADLIPLVALYRLSPLGSGMAEDFIAGRHGKRTARVLHPLMEPIVADTYGVIALSGTGHADCLRARRFLAWAKPISARRAMGKKKAKLLDSMKEKFLAGAAREHQISRQLGEEILPAAALLDATATVITAHSGYEQRIAKPMLRRNTMATSLTA